MNKIQKFWQKKLFDHHHAVHHKKLGDTNDDVENKNHGFIENLFRFFLTIIQFLFLGNLLRFFFSYQIRIYVTEIYVIFKPIFLYIILRLCLYNTAFMGEMSLYVYISYYFIFETIFYNLSLIFNSEIFLKPRSYKRTLILLLINYIEIVFGFALIYFSGNHLNERCIVYSDAIYFSFITSATIGFGDIYPVTEIGKQLVSLQSITFLTFVVIIISSFASQIKNINYEPQKNS